MIAPNTTLENMHLVAEKVRQAVQIALADNTPPVTISLGVASASGLAINQTNLMAEADSALYWAKQNGRNRVETAPVKV